MFIFSLFFLAFVSFFFPPLSSSSSYSFIFYYYSFYLLFYFSLYNLLLSSSFSPPHPPSVLPPILSPVYVWSGSAICLAKETPEGSDTSLQVPSEQSLLKNKASSLDMGTRGLLLPAGYASMLPLLPNLSNTAKKSDISSPSSLLSSGINDNKTNKIIITNYSRPVSPLSCFRNFFIHNLYFFSILPFLL